MGPAGGIHARLGRRHASAVAEGKLAPLLSLVLAVLTAVSAAFVPAYYGNRKPGYSHIRDTISELGETRSPVGRPVSYVGFLAIGVLLWLFLIAAAHVVPPGSRVS